MEIKFTRTQLTALRQAQADEAHARAIQETIDQVTDPELRLADEAMAQRLLGDALTVREAIAYVDPWARSPKAAQRIRAAVDPRCTRQTFAALDDDRDPAVREAVIRGRAAREARFPPPGSAGEYDFEPVDPMSLITAWYGGASSHRRDAD